jgi:hypothetical protein
MKPTKKAFREVLNARFAGTENYRNGPYRQVKRGYGDYLYAQDRAKFDVEYAEWKHQQVCANADAQIERMRNLLNAAR